MLLLAQQHGRLATFLPQLRTQSLGSRPLSGEASWILLSSTAQGLSTIGVPGNRGGANRGPRVARGGSHAGEAAALQSSAHLTGKSRLLWDRQLKQSLFTGYWFS